MFELKQTDTFRNWWTRLKNERARGLIFSRLSRLAYGHFGDVAAVGQGISELRIHIGPGYRVYFRKRGKTLIICCAAATREVRPGTLKPRRNSRMTGANEMAKKLTKFDPAEGLTSDEAIAAFMADAFETEDAGYIAHALGVVARAKGMSQIASETGLSREQLYRSFSENGNPTLKTTIAVMKSLGIELTAKVHA